MASLSELHTSVTALSMCVHIYLCLFGPTTYHNQMSAFKILIFHDVHANVSQLSHVNELLPDCRVSVKESESEDDSS